jgi:hypothetical protein
VTNTIVTVTFPQENVKSIVSKTEADIESDKVYKVPTMQNFSTFYFSFKHTLLDPVFSADYEYDLFSVIRQNVFREKCKILRGYRNLQNSLIL